MKAIHLVFAPILDFAKIEVNNTIKSLCRKVDLEIRTLIKKEEK